MPWWMGCLCINLPTARNLVRYQYRIAGRDTIDECVFPYGLNCLGQTFGHACPPIWVALYAFAVAITMQLTDETSQRKGGESKRYLAPHIPPQQQQQYPQDSNGGNENTPPMAFRFVNNQPGYAPLPIAPAVIYEMTPLHLQQQQQQQQFASQQYSVSQQQYPNAILVHHQPDNQCNKTL